MNRSTRFWVFYLTVTLLAVTASLTLVSCSNAAEKGEGVEVCIADALPTLERNSTTPTIPSCESSDSLCRTKCRAGSAKSCLGMGYTLDKDPANKAEAVRFYKRACLLGEPNACTNYAASIWANNHTEEQLTCARRTFEKACSAGEPFACGMVGRIMLEDTKSPQFAEARKYLEDSCEKVSGFPCRVLAKHLETGKLGKYNLSLIRSLLTRACAAGDPDACGDPATASETFN